MDKIIENLYYGRPYLREHNHSIKNEIEYMENDLLKTLNDKEKEIFNHLKDACGVLEKEIAYKNFKYGFKLAFKMIFKD